MAPTRMSRQTYLVLRALSARALHGYGIVTAVLELSGGRVRLGAGTLYGMLGRLVAQGLVEPSGEEVVAGRLRRYYRLTPAGTAATSAEAARLAAAARTAHGVRAPRPALGEA